MSLNRATQQPNITVNKSMQISLDVPDNLPIEMVKNYLRTIEMQMQLFSQTIAETSNQAAQLRQLFKET